MTISALENKKNLVLNLCLTALYAAFTLLIVIHHECWADEGQVWQICKNISFFGLFKHLVNEGHPSLFYLIIMPFAKLNFSIFTMQIICWLASVLAVFLYLQFSPFSKVMQICTVLSVGFLYYFPIIARNYSIIPILVFLSAILYKKQKEHPIFYACTLFLLANTHILMLGFVTMLLLIYVYDNIIKEKPTISTIISTSIIATGIIAVVLQLSGTTQSNIFIHFNLLNIVPATITTFIKFFTNPYNDFIFEYNMGIKVYDLFFILLSATLFIGMNYFLLKTDKKIFAACFWGILFQLFVYIVSYNDYIYVNRIFLAYLILLFGFWVAWKNVKKPQLINLLFILFFIITIPNSIKNCLLDLKMDYSGAKATAEFINTQLPPDAIVLTDNGPFVMGIPPYLKNIQLFYLNQNTYLKYLVWNEKVVPQLMPSHWDLYITKYIKPSVKTQNIYFIIPLGVNSQLYNTDIDNAQLVFETSNVIIKREMFKIYKYIKK